MKLEAKRSWPQRTVRQVLDADASVVGMSVFDAVAATRVRLMGGCRPIDHCALRCIVRVVLKALHQIRMSSFHVRSLGMLHEIR